ncbi:MAG: MiaB/RimO family radical SAM methylthiotransferase [Roseburia sp.]|nr:MiaB/RimO family radical SAM methylthiotransferase [Roseburia sp.]
MKSVAFHNLGCKVNSYELDVMQQRLLERGYEIVPFSQKADIYIINTCTVTNMADRKSRQMLHRAKQKNPRAVVVAVGCYVQTDLAGAVEDGSIDLCIGNNRKKDLVQILEEYLRLSAAESQGEEQGEPAGQGAAGRKTLYGKTVIDIDNTYEYEEMSLKKTADHTRAYIKIQDGCNQFCSYCAIPLARGRVRSRRAEDIIAEIQDMTAAGYREVVLTGIHISSYGIDFEEASWGEGRSVRALQTSERLDYSGRSKLLELVERIHEIPGLERIRLGSLEPRIVTPEAVGRLAALPKLCPHFHLSLQSGCDTVLQRMNRHYTTGQYGESLQALRAAFACPAITTDVIVGFPGETQEEFETTRAFLEQAGFYEMHIFKYSQRAGTHAAKMPGQVPEQIKTVRSNELLKLERTQSEAFRRKLLGRETEVLWEEDKVLSGSRYHIGHTREYVKAALPGELPVKQGEISRVKLKEFLTEEILLAEK